VKMGTAVPTHFASGSPAHHAVRPSRHRDCALVGASNAAPPLYRPKSTVESAQNGLPGSNCGWELASLAPELIKIEVSTGT
jgi:hypothetical protein